MIILDTGAAPIVYASPVLSVFVTIIVALIEAYYIKRKIKSIKWIFYISLFINAITTIIGFVLIDLLSLNNYYIDFYGWLIHYSNRGIYYVLRILIVLIGLYFLTILIEIPFYRCFIKNIKIKSILIANLLSYAFIAIIYYFFDMLFYFLIF
jgi:hypothetical protein